MTLITLITNEMISDYIKFSGKKIDSIEDYMVFRKQAVSEINTIPVNTMSAAAGGTFFDTESITEPVRQCNLEHVSLPEDKKNQKNDTKSEKKENVIHYKEENKEDVRDDDDFLACINKIQD